jgi:ankyrin repeat protein
MSVRNAANMGNLSEVERLIAAGANLNARRNNGYTALMSTVVEANNRPRGRAIIRALIMAGANVSGPNGRTVRNYARISNQNANTVAFINALLAAAPRPGRPVLSVQAKANLRAKANTPVSRNWTVLKNKADPISLLNINNWNGNKGIEVNQNGRKTYFTLGSFNGYYGNRWKTMAPNSNNSIHYTRTHPSTRKPIMRKNVRLVKFIGNKANKANKA